MPNKLAIARTLKRLKLARAVRAHPRFILNEQLTLLVLRRGWHDDYAAFTDHVGYAEARRRALARRGLA